MKIEIEIIKKNCLEPPHIKVMPEPLITPTSWCIFKAVSFPLSISSEAPFKCNLKFVFPFSDILI